MVDRRQILTGLGATALPLAFGRAARAAPAPAASVALVHGAYADGSSWAEVIPLLQDAGLTVAAVQNPLTSLADDVAATRRTLAILPDPIVLAGHSWGGTVITEAGLDPKVKALVYVAARAPDVDEDYAALAGRFQTPPASAGLVRDGGFGQLSEEAFLRDFANGVDPRRARGLYAVQGRIADDLFAARTTQAAWRSKPAFYAVSTQDRTTATALQRYVAERMRAETVMLDTGHLSPVTHPRQIADLILRAAAAETAHG